MTRDRAVAPAAARCALAAALLALAGPAAAAPAFDASAGEVRALALAAERDPAALQRLRAVDAIDGVPADLDRALGSEPAQVRARLRVLAGDDGGVGSARGRPARPAAAARADARSVLSDARYRPSSFPTPLRDPLRRVGEVIAGPLERAYEWLVARLPGGGLTVWSLLAATLLAAGAALAARAGARRQRVAARAHHAASGRPPRRGAAELLRDADAAERSGALELALRLRFRAGLAALEQRELIELRPALTNHELLAAVRSPTLPALVARFEAVAYGGRPAVAGDVRAARDGWPRVLDEAAAR